MSTAYCDKLLKVLLWATHEDREIEAVQKWRAQGKICLLALMVCSRRIRWM